MSAFRFLLALSLAALQSLGQAAGSAAAADLVVEFEGVRSDRGQVRVVLCRDATGGFPGGCHTHAGAADASTGVTRVTIAGVAAGRYALQAFHDENGNGRPEIPPEGFAFGNGAAWPPTFETASMTVTPGQEIKVPMTYPGAPSAAAPARKLRPLVLPAARDPVVRRPEIAFVASALAEHAR